MDWAAVPEAPIQVDGHMLPLEEDIRTAAQGRDGLCVDAKFVAMRLKMRSNGKL